jgi:hypothetical protein
VGASLLCKSLRSIEAAQRPNAILRGLSGLEHEPTGEERLKMLDLCAVVAGTTVTAQKLRHSSFNTKYQLLRLIDSDTQKRVDSSEA